MIKLRTRVQNALIQAAFAGITVITLASVTAACQPTTPKDRPVPTVECRGDDDASLAGQYECVWHADQHGMGTGRSFYSYDYGRRIVYFSQIHPSR